MAQDRLLSSKEVKRHWFIKSKKVMKIQKFFWTEVFDTTFLSRLGQLWAAPVLCQLKSSAIKDWKLIGTSWSIQRQTRDLFKSKFVQFNQFESDLETKTTSFWSVIQTLAIHIKFTSKSTRSQSQSGLSTMLKFPSVGARSHSMMTGTTA